MKKIIFLFVALILSACTPQVTVTSEVTVTFTPQPTQTPIPTPTFHPAFVEMQSRLADLGFTLQADGTVEETTADGGRQTLPNLFVSPEGIISLSLADGTVVSVDPQDMSVDEAGGLKIKVYELDENGEWVVAANIVKLDKGITLTLEDADGDGISEVVEVSIDNDNLSEEQKEFLVNQLDPGYVGFTPDEATLYYDAEKQTYWVGSADNPSNVIARQDSETGRLIWDFDKMKDKNGESILFRIAHTWEMKGVDPVDMESAKLDSQELDEKRVDFEITNEYYKERSIYRFSLSIYHYNLSGDLAIGGCLVVDDSANPLMVNRVDESGRVCLLSKDRQVIVFMVENFDSTTRFWR